MLVDQATLIAHLMKTYRLGFLQSYFLVRVQRFNIIIQPNLKLFYELYLFDQWLDFILIINLNIIIGKLFVI